MARRLDQVNDLIRAEVGAIIKRDVDFPLRSLVTITRARTAADLHYADVLVSVMPQTNEAEVLEILASQIVEIQQKLNRKLRMRPVPRIKFMIDLEQKQADRIERLLAVERLKNKE
jgi:ribosome-binding factor A